MVTGQILPGNLRRNPLIVYQDYVLNAYLWLLLGILFRLPTLAMSAQFAAIQPGLQFQQSLQQPLRQPLSHPYHPRMR